MITTQRAYVAPVLPPRRNDLSIAQGFGFVVAARARGDTRCISSSRAGATEPKNKRAAGHYASRAALVVRSWVALLLTGRAATAPSAGSVVAAESADVDDMEMLLARDVE